MEKINISHILTSIVGFLILIIFSPVLLFVLIFVIPFEKWEKLRYDRQRKQFLKIYNGKILFLYSSKKLWYEYINEFVIPILSDQIIIIYNNAGKIKSNVPIRIFNYYYHQIDKIKYPLFMKIDNENATAVSIYEDLLALKNNEINISEFQNRINLKIIRINN